MEGDDARRFDHPMPIETIRYNSKPTEMSADERRSLDEIASSTIRMHLAENVYFIMGKETIAYTL